MRSQAWDSFKNFSGNHWPIKHATQTVSSALSRDQLQYKAVGVFVNVSISMRGVQKTTIQVTFPRAATFH